MAVKNKKRVLLSALLLSMILLLGLASLCLASGAGDLPLSPPAGKPPMPNFYVIGWSIVDFLILLALLYKFAFNPINEMLEKRSNTIESSLKHAEDVKAEVEQMRKESHANLNEARKEAQEIVAKALKNAEESKNEMILRAQEEVAVMKQKAQNEIQATTEQAKQELREASATLAIMAAEKVLNHAITEEDHKRMVKDFVNEAGDFLC